MTQLTRRGLLKAAARVVAGGIGAGALGSVYSTLVEPNWLQVETVRIPLAELHAALQGFKIAHFSDTHFGPFFDHTNAQRVVRMINGLEPDLIVFTGDLVSRLSQGEAELGTRMLRELDAPEGAFAVLGNHDHWTDPGQVADAIEAGAGMLLRNGSRRIERDGGGFWLAGVDDIWEGKQDLDRALEGTTSGEPVILLAHEPDYADRVAADGRVALQLSGHSHGGQVRIPFLGAPVLPYLGQRYPFGLRRVGNLTLYTNRGVGMLAPPVRWNCRPEITEILLEPADGKS